MSHKSRESLDKQQAAAEEKEVTYYAIRLNNDVVYLQRASPSAENEQPLSSHERATILLYKERDEYKFNRNPKLVTQVTKSNELLNILLLRQRESSEAYKMITAQIKANKEIIKEASS